MPLWDNNALDVRAFDYATNPERLHVSDILDIDYWAATSSIPTCASVNVSKGPGGQEFFEFDWTADGMRQQYVVTGPVRSDSGWNEHDPTAQPTP